MRVRRGAREAAAHQRQLILLLGEECEDGLALAALLLAILLARDIRVHLLESRDAELLLEVHP